MRFVIFCLLPLLFAFNFSPMTQTMRIGDGQKKVQFQVENSTNEPIPVVIKVVSRHQKEDGTEDLPKTEDFKVFPPQMVIPPGDKRTIRVDWKGKTDFAAEKSYRVIAEQVPLDISKKKNAKAGGIKMLLRYQAALYVDPGNTKSHLVVKKFEQGKKLKIYLENKGNAHQYLNNFQLKFVSEKKTITIPKEQLKPLEGQNVLAHTVRLFEFSTSLEIPAKAKGIIEFEK